MYYHLFTSHPLAPSTFLHILMRRQRDLKPRRALFTTLWKTNFIATYPELIRFILLSFMISQPPLSSIIKK